MTNSKEILSKNKSDLLASAGKSVLGAVPHAGAFLAELVEAVIPNQRIDRVSKYVIELEARLSKVEEKV